MSRLVFRNHFRLVGGSTERAKAMLEGSNCFVAMVTAIAELRTTEKTVFSSHFHPERIWRCSRGLSSNGTENRVKGQKKSSKTASEKGLWNDRSSPFCTDSGKAKEYRPSILMC
jgi:hypothetical protein